MENVIKNNVYGFIYKITNTINGKAYIGQHIGTELGNYWGSGIMLPKAYKKYGIDAFKREIVDYASSVEELNFLERYYIQKMDSLNPKGYNIALGGFCGGSKYFTKESIEKIRMTHLGKPKSEEHKKKLSEVKKGKPQHPQSEETRKKMSIAHLGIEPWNKGKGKSIMQLTMNGELVQTWSSLTEASLHGYNKSKISECLHGTREHHRHFLWRLNNG